MWASAAESLCFKGPIIYPVLDLYVSSWTPLEEPYTINYPKKIFDL